MRLTSIALLVLTFALPSSAEVTARKRALIEEMLRFANADSTAAEIAELPAGQIEMFDRHLSEKQLQEIIAFYKSDTGRSYMEAQKEILAEVRKKMAATLEQAIERSKLKRTMADMRTLAVAIEARATDTNNYPVAGDIDAIARLIEPTYVRETPKRDGWDGTYRYAGTKDGQHYRIASGGPDQSVDPGSLQIGKMPAEASDDLIFEDGVFLRPAKNP
jgi:hypothetical protein